MCVCENNPFPVNKVRPLPPDSGRILVGFRKDSGRIYEEK